MEVERYNSYKRNIKGLLTEREVCMGKYQTEVLTVRTERSEVRT